MKALEDFEKRSACIKLKESLPPGGGQGQKQGAQLKDMGRRTTHGF